MHDELKQEIVGLESARTILKSVLDRLELYHEALDDANVRIYTGELWRIDPDGGELLEPLRVALERANDAQDYQQEWERSAERNTLVSDTEWPKYYVPIAASHGTCYYQRFADGSIYRVKADGEKGTLWESWGEHWAGSVSMGALRQIAAEDAETIPRELPKAGTWEWATWQMHQGKCASPVDQNIPLRPHRIHQGRLQWYAWGVGEWMDHTHTHQREHRHENCRWKIVADPDGALTE